MITMKPRLNHHNVGPDFCQTDFDELELVYKDDQTVLNLFRYIRETQKEHAEEIDKIERQATEQIEGTVDDLNEVIDTLEFEKAEALEHRAKVVKERDGLLDIVEKQQDAFDKCEKKLEIVHELETEVKRLRRIVDFHGLDGD